MNYAVDNLRRGGYVVSYVYRFVTMCLHFAMFELAGISVAYLRALLLCECSL